MKRDNSDTSTATTMCAIYTRVSTTEGLGQDYNSLEAQRDAGEAFVASQRGEGWVCLDTGYDDGGYTGSNTDRPALRRLIADIHAGKIDCVVVYKVDRLSRSLRDFLELMELCQKHGVMFVSVTQAFNTATSMGRLTLNVLLSFAQFEREMISERTRDKIAAARRKGHWVGGVPVLGYDVVDTRLVVNGGEAQRVREIFELYLEKGGLIPVVQELDRRGWKNKASTTKDGRERGGKPFTKTNVHRLLTNVTYLGKVRYKEEIHEGKHAAIIDPGIWQKTQVQLARNGRNGGSAARNKSAALLKGILRCAACNCQMSPTYASKNGKRYTYYRCQQGQRQGRGACPCPSVSAHQIERIVVEQIRHWFQTPELIAETFRQAVFKSSEETITLRNERGQLQRNLARWNADCRQLLDTAMSSDPGNPAVARLADLQERIREGEQRAAQLKSQLTQVSCQELDEPFVAEALRRFDPAWEALTPREQVQVVQLLVERVEFDGVADKVSITLNPTGMETFVNQELEQPA